MPLSRRLAALGLLAFASLALVASDSAAKPKKRTNTAQPSGQSQPAPHATARPRTRGAQPAPATGPQEHGRATTRTRRHGKRTHGRAMETTSTRAENYARQGRGVIEGELSPVLENASCPADMAIVDGRFCVDKYEGSLVQVMANGQEKGWSPFEMVADGVKVRAVSVAGVTPQAYISGAQAEEACAASSKRLCKPVEWRTACMGPKKMLYGYANERRPSTCNDHGRAPMGHFYPEVATSWRLVGMTEMNDPQLNQLDGTLMKTGSNPDCTNEYGVYDMVGNLHEWTNDPNGTFQGGYYLDTHINGDGCGYRTTAHEFQYHDYSTGFRCCSDPTQSSPRDPAAAGATTASATSTATPAPIPTPPPPAPNPYENL